MHLVIDGNSSAPDKLSDSDLVYRFLDQHPDAIGMTKITEPQVYTYHGKTPEDWGVSGFVLIAESHISVHTFPDRAHVNVDIFSCKDFDTTSSVDVVKAAFSLTEVSTRELERGLEYATPGRAYHGMVRERVNLIAETPSGD